MKDAWTWVKHRHFPRHDRWDPFLAVHYLTYACDFRCPYCSDGQGRPYPERAPGHLPEEKALELLRRIRGVCDRIELTGGEPLLHPSIEGILRALPALEFRETVLTTNGWHLPRHLDSVERSIDTLVMSLDTLDPVRAAHWYGKGPETLPRLLENLEQAARRFGRRMVLSAVATAETLEELPALMDHAHALGIHFACYPQLEGVRVPPTLSEHPGYRPVFQELLEAKRKGKRIWATTKALEWMRDLPKIPCRPFTLVAIEPDGRVFYPCLERGTHAGSLLEEPDLHRLRLQGLASHGPQPDCPTQCHSACTLGFASILQHPSTLLSEAACGLRRVLDEKRP